MQNYCPTIADEAVSTEMADPLGPDWYRTGLPAATYNCLGYAVGHQDLYLWDECVYDPNDDGWIGIPQARQFMSEWFVRVGATDYYYRPAANCFPECGVRKVAALGVWRDDMREFVVNHFTVEVGDRDALDPASGNWWKSKFGASERVLHRFFDVTGDCFTYGGVHACWERDDSSANAALCDPGYDPAQDPVNQPPEGFCEAHGAHNYLLCPDEFCAAWPDACQLDPDVDGVPWPIDTCPGVEDVGEDADEDGVDDACDNCIDIWNPDQENCDEGSDDGEPSDRRGDACDPDPCARWQQADADDNPMELSEEDVGMGMSLVGRVARFEFDALGGEMSAAELGQAFEDNYLDAVDETFQDTRPAYCSCANVQGCGDQDCERDGVFDGDPITGRDWLPMTLLEAGDESPELIPDVRYVRGGPGGAGGSWLWGLDHCPREGGGAARDCETIFNQQFHFWLRPMVDDATWPTGWPEDRHNFYTEGEHRLETFEVPNNNEEPFWPGWRLIPEGSCFHCEMAFFEEEMLGFIGEFAPGLPLPPYSPFLWDGYSTGEPVQGMALGLFDPQTLSLRRYVPSEGATPADEPAVTGALVAVEPPAGSGLDATLWLFGGVTGSGDKAGELYRGDLVQGSIPDDDRLVWHHLTTTGETPEGRVGGLLAYEPSTHSLVLHGGMTDGDKALGGLYRFDIATSTWSRVGVRLGAGVTGPGQRGFAAHAQRGARVYLYGGRRTDGTLLDDLWMLEPSTGTFRVVGQDCAAAGGGMAAMGGGRAAVALGNEVLVDDPAAFEGADDLAVEADALLAEVDEDAPVAIEAGAGALQVLTSEAEGPGPRSAASLAVDRGGLLLYGGIGTSGPQTDLWRFDLSSGCWERLVRSCTGGGCPPAGSQGLLPAPDRRRGLLVPSIGSEIHPEIAWHFESLRADRSPSWIPEGEWTQDPWALDCNDNGVPDSGVGFACTTSSYWYDPPGARGCTASGAVSCPQTTAPLEGLYSVSGSSPVRFAARGQTLVTSSAATLRRYLLAEGSAPVQTGSAAMNGSAVGIVLDGPRAFVATTTNRVQSFSIAGTGLSYQGQRTFTSAIGAIGGDGRRLYVVSGNKLWILDSSSPTLPTIGSVTLPQSSATALAVAGRKVVIANGSLIVVVSVVNPAAPTIQGTLSIGTGTTGLRARGTRVYGVKTTSGYVIDVSNPAAPVNVGSHNALEWAKGAAHLGAHSVRVSGTTVQVAELAP